MSQAGTGQECQARVPLCACGRSLPTTPSEPQCLHLVSGLEGSSNERFSISEWSLGQTALFESLLQPFGFILSVSVKGSTAPDCLEMTKLRPLKSHSEN